MGVIDLKMGGGGEGGGRGVNNSKVTLVPQKILNKTTSNF